MTEEREKLPLIFLTPLSDVLDSAKRQILKDSDIELYEVNFKELKPEEFMKRIPGVIVSGNPQEAVAFLKLYDEVVKKSSSKMILITEEEASPKAMKVIKNLRLADYVYGNVQPKTILYKIKLHLKALPDLDEKALDDHECAERKRTGGDSNNEEGNHSCDQQTYRFGHC